MMTLVCGAVLLLQSAAADTLTLDQALARARQLRGAATVAAAGVAEARAGVRVAGTISNPVLHYGYSESPPRQQVTAEQSLAWLTRRGPDRATAGALLERSRSDSLLLLAELAREVRSAFYHALGAQVRRDLALAQAGLADSLIRLAERREQAGDVSRLEVLRARQEAGRAWLVLSLAREEAAVALAELVRATGGRDGRRVVPAGALDAGLDEASVPVQADHTGLPIVVAARADAAAAAGRLQSARWSQLPMPSIVAGTEWDDPADPAAGSLLILGVSLPFPLWQHGGGAVAAARASLAIASARAHEAELEAARELTVRQDRLAERAHRARFSRDSLVSGARALREGAFRLYSSGGTSILEVFDGFRAEREAEGALVAALVTWQEAAAGLDALMGRSE